MGLAYLISSVLLQLWAYFNHFIRFAGGELCAEDLESLKGWTFKWNPNWNGELTDQGKQDLSSLAKRLKNKLNNLLNNPKEKFVVSVTQRLSEKSCDKVANFPD